MRPYDLWSFLWFSPQLFLIFSLLEITLPSQSWQKWSCVHTSAATGKVSWHNPDSSSTPCASKAVGIGHWHVFLFCLLCCGRGNLCKRWNTQLCNSCRSCQSSSGKTFVSCLPKRIFCKEKDIEDILAE